MPAAEQGHPRTGLGGIDDPLEAAGGGEVAAEADIHRSAAGGDDLVDTIVVGAAVGVAVVALEGVGAIVVPGRVVAAHQVGVAAAAAIEAVIAAAALDQIGACGADHRVVAVAGIDQKIAADQGDCGEIK